MSDGDTNLDQYIDELANKALKDSIKDPINEAINELANEVLEDSKRLSPLKSGDRITVKEITKEQKQKNREDWR